LNLSIYFYLLLLIVISYFYYAAGREKKLKINFDFPHREVIPEKYSLDGENISPALEIENISKKAKSMVLILENIDTDDLPAHWLIWNIPPDINKIPAGISPRAKITRLGEACQGENDFGTLGYRGPSQKEEAPGYRFKLFTLEEKLNLEPGVKKEELEEKMKGLILQQQAYYAKFE